MKNKLLQVVFITICLLPSFSSAQGGSPSNTRLGPGNFLGFSGGIPGQLDIRNDFNQQMLFSTNSFTRMIIDNGGGLQAGGRIAIGNNLPAGFNPSARLHIHQITAATTSNTPFVKFTTNVTGSLVTDGFSIGNSSQALLPNVGEVHLMQYETEPMILSAPNANPTSTNLLPYEWFRIENGKIFLANPLAPIRNTDGYIGLNKPNPRSHIEMNTPAFQGGEEFFLAKPSDIYDPPASTTPALNVQMGMMNLTANDNFFLPGVFGNINQSNQWGTALAMLGCIPPAQDIVGNPPVMRFSVGKNWILNSNTPIPVGTTPVTATVQTRPIFAWENGSPMMYMAANGRLRIGYSLTLSNPTQVGQRPNNRIEITAATFDPYFDPVGNPIGNPNAGLTNFGSASGLRFTFLTSRDLVIAPNATNQIDPSKVLSVDVNGDVVAIYPALGAPCSNTTQIAAQTFTSSRAVNQGTFNMEWRGQGRNGFGTNNCSVGNRVEITGLNSFSATPGGNSGLRFSLLTSTTTAINNPTNKVLTVNANGDVILVTDQSGTVTAGAIAAQNGLTLVGTNTVELGGTLIHPVTTIDFAGNELNFTNGSPTKLYVRGANGGTYAKAVGPPPFGTPETSFYEDVTATTVNSAFGRELNVTAASSAVGSFFLVGSRVIVNAAPVSSVALSGDVVGNWSRSQNTGGSAKGNFAFKAEAMGAGPAGINAGYISSASGSSKNYGFYSELVNTFISQEDIGIKSLMQANALSTNVLGGDFSTTRGINAYGVRAFAQSGTTTNYGVHTRVPAGVAGSSNYGIWAEAPISATNVSYAGYFQGQTYFNGNINGVGVNNYVSDQTFKTNIDTITNATNIIKQLKPRTFYFDTTNVNNINFPNEKQYGLIAQDVETILPELVGSTTKPAERDSLGNVTAPSVTYKNLNYNAFIAILIKGMQQQQKTIEKQDSTIQQIQSQLSALTSSVTSCCSSSAVRTTSQAEQNQLTINLTDKDVIVLNQNVPNPFAEQTTITYNVPEKYGYAQMIFSTIDGRILKTVDITKKGRGQLNVFSNDLSSGMYTYSLVVDGKVMDTKKMVKSE